MKNFLVLCGLIGSFVFGQELEYEHLKWDDSPVREVLGEAYVDEQEVILQYEKIIEYAYSEKYENNLVEYVTLHKKVRVFGDDAIQRNNKVYISMNNVAELVEAKARVITPTNEVIDFDESAIIKSEGGDGIAAHQYFAIDGVVAGSDIEYTYTLLRGPAYKGTKLEFQDELPRRNINFKLASPPNLVFVFKSYNGFPEVMQDSTNTDKNIYRASVDSMPPLIEEEYAAYFRDIQYVVYKLDKNLATYTLNIVSFGEVSQNLFANYYSEIDKSSTKALKKFIAQSGADKAGSEEDKIRKLENHIKTTIGLVDNINVRKIADMMDDGITSGAGMTYLTIQALKMLGIKHELVVTCDRYSDYFDRQFEHYQVLQNYMIYFPNSKKYMVPDDILYRYPFAPPEWMNQDGLFVKEVVVGELTTGVGKIKKIAPMDSDATQDNMEITIDFADISQPVLDVKHSMTGYSAVYFQAIYALLDEENKKTLDEGNLKFADENGELLDYEVTGATPEDCGVNPMVYTGHLKTTSLMEKAGNRYLFKIGQLIGPQMEMYKEDERKEDIEHDHNMVYHRTITFEIPEGYTLSGLESLVINETYPAEDPKIRFVSDYTQEGNKVTVTIVEEYKEMFFKKEEIDDFRRIINAAANFNKVVLFISK